MTRVEGRVARPISLNAYADITDAPLVRWGRDFLEFDGELMPEQVEAIWARMESTDDADQAARANLRALVSEHSDCALSVALTNYVLGDAP